MKNRHFGDVFYNWRGREVSRIEALSDIVYGFSLTLIVVSSEVPNSFTELGQVFLQLPAFAICFGLLILCWYCSYQFHRRYGLEDKTTIMLTVIQLFLVLFYIFPLKFLFTMVTETYLSPGTRTIEISFDQLPYLFMLYGCGWVGIFTLFALLYRNALSRKEDLELTPLEITITRCYGMSHLYTALIGIASIFVCVLAIPIKGNFMIILAGNIYVLMGPVLWWNEKKLRIIKSTAKQVEELSPSN